MPTTPTIPTLGSVTSAANDRAFWRYYFAGQALAGLMANDRWTAGDEWLPAQDAESAVSQADALIAALEETTP